MKKIDLKEASDLFKTANRVLIEEYDIMPNSFYDGADDESYPEEYNETENGDVKNDSKVIQIRKIAIQGLQEYSHDVDSENYQFFKKIWLMCDKAVSSKENNSDSSM